MGNKKIYELAKEINKTNKETIEIANSLGIEVKSHLNNITEEEANKIILSLENKEKIQEIKEAISKDVVEKASNIIKVISNRTIQADLIQKEIERLVEILNRRKKNNPCIIGEPGVGKTALAQGLALRIVEGNVPAKLMDKEIYLLDMGALVAGTQFRGQFEGRLERLVKECKFLGNIVLVIDEIHTITKLRRRRKFYKCSKYIKTSFSKPEICRL